MAIERSEKPEKPEKPHVRLRRQAAELDAIRCYLEPLVVTESELEEVALAMVKASDKLTFRTTVRKGTLKIGKHPVWLL